MENAQGEGKPCDTLHMECIGKIKKNNQGKIKKQGKKQIYKGKI